MCQYLRVDPLDAVVRLGVGLFATARDGSHTEFSEKSMWGPKPDGMIRHYQGPEGRGGGGAVQRQLAPASRKVCSRSRYRNWTGSPCTKIGSAVGCSMEAGAPSKHEITCVLAGQPT